MEATKHVAASTGPGQRTIAVPTRRHRRVFIRRLGSNSLKKLPTVSTAGPSVSAAKTATSMPIAMGAPSVSKYGSRAKLRQYMAPAMVKPEPKITWAVP
ncbi:Uncharacterised protein [Mycobacterium tuberculosis]|uniref:Uncharacterized protein n=1 Tax=Mycobacterium tuberculosis TaxID=1773 RepID=A0A654TYM9_MYCTX|nr:Uncharacterised protein [Mycobacterium tuberculosis]CFE52152.1 Uncharacterised protein [Mycobacterium tuberculosis]CFR72947.1 Uncharacterised protein [Mycobacterium tuberculosis]CKR68038.1 Uncharacterised protein [Mycobacterium tuberculosis]CKS19003.1 Uncharacterised protein [Mycobacterium tuberculosis]